MSGAGEVRHENRLPALTSTEKGTRNFAEAASQTQYLTEARFFPMAKVNSHAAAAQRVDCNR
jgi:hypothetical protein